MKPEITRRNFVKTSAAAGAITLASPALITSLSAAPKHTLTFGHTFGAATENYMITGLSQFKAAAEKYAEGELLIDIHEAGSLGGQNVLPQKVLTGAQASHNNNTPRNRTGRQ